jgi:hypothetical protein
MTAANKRYSYPRVAVIRIDVQPAWENLINTPHTFMLDSRMVLNHTSLVVRVDNLSLVPTRQKHAPTPRRSLGNRSQTGPAVTLGHLILPPSR